VSVTGFKVAEETVGADRLIRFAGKADLLSIPLLEPLFKRLERERYRALFIDLSATQFINSPVWALITLFSRKKKDAGIVVVGMSDPIQNSFEMMGLNQTFASFPTLQEAQAALNQDKA
jgi:anti-anti-sigma regulatory factor